MQIFVNYLYITVLVQNIVFLKIRLDILINERR